MSSYLVIARKWRPSLFEEIVGQAHVTRTLSNAVSSGRVAHAYLFSGPRGVGKTTAARILAKCLNCAEGPTPTPCNNCESCKTIASGSSVDVFEIDGASNTGVDNVRELRESVRYVPTRGKYKIYIIDEVHMLSTAAFNALLKTLEEPPPHAAFIFATTEVHKIPATILSRCQRFDFKRIPFRDIYAHLKKILTAEGVKFEDKAVYTLAREADGSLRDGQSLLEQSLAFGGAELKDSDVIEALGLMDREMLFSLSEGMISGSGSACLNIVEKIYEFGYDLKRALSDLLEHIRDLTVLKVTGNAELLDLPD
ncbi:MAG: DNA polymerase III, subunit gamma and tau, partial [Deltaproteobacteria bacterium RBG_19FT_COMBO_58_16]